jgi:DUF971 family protein
VSPADDTPSHIGLSTVGLRVDWRDGGATLPATRLRAACRCAVCSSAALAGQPVPLDAGVRLLDAVPVGHYALQLLFSDGHERGIYPWALLRQIAQDDAQIGSPT